MTKRMTKRKQIVLKFLEEGFEENIELYRKLRFLAQHRELVDRSFDFKPEHYIRSFNRTIKDNFFTGSAPSTKIPAYFLLIDIYYELLESGLISSNLRPKKLVFFIVGNFCVVVARLGDKSYCQIAQKPIVREINFISKKRIEKLYKFEDWITGASTGFNTYLVTRDGLKAPVMITQPISPNSLTRVFLEEEGLFIDTGKSNFVGFS